MPDNLVTQAATLSSIPANTGIAARAVTYSGDANQYIGPTCLVSLAGADDAKTATDVPLPTALGANGGIKVDIVGDTGVASALDTDDASVAAGQGGVALVIELGYVFNGSTWVRGGFTPNVTISAASTNATNLKASAGVIGAIAVGNTNAAARYLKLYDKATAPTVGTDTPVATYLIPGNTAGAGSNIPINPKGKKFVNGISFALTTGAPHSDTGAVGANEITVNIDWL